ncbi:phenylalanine--tRNA ligase subunit alpha [Deinococcus radiophilus]|uniref:Phenylalanine--tRNA ligase alpha subunit n=1 Tax=Deinococcus radiophilus TaxID=32062 RepID=A0A3S0ICL1_9DEIO|nr:phenylalanine--tRNA ligase subunit alpha [Deinococcus radiophilus]RTR29502.1 phenylalanine--tRNA ligase subunit alpha [Deinococcus radiophilus]UFA51354.1 phenylalanine--tRNA ligase subunit alpha [Deinococcus radiophilus]
MQQEALAEIAAAGDLDALQQVKTKYVGKKGLITQQLGSLGGLAPEERKSRGAEINVVRQAVQGALDKREALLKRAALDAKLQGEALDVTLPGLGLPSGGLHPINRVYSDLIGIFTRLGYEVAEGPEVEEEHYNFGALNIPWYHPARELQDTFWLKDGPDGSSEPGVPRRLLRTHTSNMQIRYMVEHEPPLKMVSRGKVYRYEATDATHEAMFHQLEGLVVGEGISMADLKGTIAEMARGLYGAGAKVRFQPSYYPFVEPGADFAVWWENPRGESKWLELGGCGMVHPHVFKAVDDLREAAGKERVYEGLTGFAFGLGPERIAMLKYGIPDIRYFYANDPRVMRQFRGELG